MITINAGVEEGKELKCLFKFSENDEKKEEVEKALDILSKNISNAWVSRTLESDNEYKIAIFIKILYCI